MMSENPTTVHGLLRHISHPVILEVRVPFFPRSIMRRAAVLGGLRNILRVIPGALTTNILGLTLQIYSPSSDYALP